MIGYIFETKCLKTGKKFIGKRLSTAFDSRYIGDNDALQKDALAYGPQFFVCKMLMPYETEKALDAALTRRISEIAGDASYYNNANEEAAKRRRRKLEEKAEEE